eukprot:PhM_4_TR7125/c0_g2_i1/m.90285
MNRIPPSSSSRDSIPVSSTSASASSLNDITHSLECPLFEEQQEQQLHGAASVRHARSTSAVSTSSSGNYNINSSSNEIVTPQRPRRAASMNGGAGPTYYSQIRSVSSTSSVSSVSSVLNGSVSSAMSSCYVTPRALGRVGYARWVGSTPWILETESEACQTSPLFCMLACVCPCAVAGAQRHTLLLGDVAHNYTQPCAGVFCPSYCCGPYRVAAGRSAATPPPPPAPAVLSWLCLLVEATLCLPIAVHANRYIIQQHYHLEPTSWDNRAAACG